jgi:prepilin-type N-terminal cleavage/methylation domain-containing protein/prepilin-type processing-associated H-X9-DG protein
MRPKIELKTGFTLIELLAVTGIIALLASLLLTAVNLAIGKARRVTCMNNLRQINLGVRMYSEDANDQSPGKTAGNGKTYVLDDYKELMKNYVGLRGASSAHDKLFACPADVYYYPYFVCERSNTATCVEESWCAQSNSDYSSYAFNAGNLLPSGRGTGRLPTPGIAGLTLGSIRHPSRTVLVAEAPAFIPFSWHQPSKLLFWIMQSGGCRPTTFFNNSMNMVSFVDGHVSYVKIYFQIPANSADWFASCYNPPDGYDYQWSGD